MSADERERIRATTEADVQRQMAEDGDEDYDPARHHLWRLVLPYPAPADLRQRLAMSDDAFARAFGLNLEQLRAWEAGRAEPDTAARTLLRVIDRAPDVVRAAVAGA